MPKPAVLSILAAGLVATAAVLFGPQLFAPTEAPTMTWTLDDEIPVATADPIDAAVAAGDPTADARTQLLPGDEDIGADERTALVLRGRVVDRYRQPVADAKVWLDFGRGGPRGGDRQRRVPDPVQSDAQGRFAFQGQTFRNLRVALLVAHAQHAPTHFERNLGEVAAEMDLGDLTITDGGELIGRVTDLDGNGVPGAEVRLQPENENRFRFRREQDQMPALAVDNNGYYRLGHVAAGDWRVAATAAHHENGMSETVTVVEDQRFDVADIRLGPGYELSGVVSDASGTPIADAEVVARAVWQPGNGGGNGNGGGRRGGRGGPGGGGPGQGGFGGNDHRTRTNPQGRFYLEHLPGTPLEVTVHKDGYLTAREADVDARVAQPLYVTLQDGLVLTGVVTDAASGAPVTKYQVTAERLRGLPTGAAGDALDWNEAMRMMRDGNMDDATRQRLRATMESMRQVAGERQDWADATRAIRGQGGRGNRERRLADHPGGRFRETGLQEGVYVVVVESAAHASFRSAEVELRLGTVAAELEIALDKGLSVQGLVRDADGQPIVGAKVELRTAEDVVDASAQTGGGRRGGGPGGRRGGQDPMRQFLNNLAGNAPSATTDRTGQFVIEHAVAGRYRVVADAKGHSQARTEPFALAADTKGIELTMDSLGRLQGHVLGAKAEQLGEARVVAVPVGAGADIGSMFRGGSRPFADVKPDGSYHLDELAPGDYAVRAFLGNGMRDLFAQYAAGEMLADVTVRAGATTERDVTLLLPQVGTVNGSVLHNGAPANGFQVALQRTDDGNDGGGGPGGFGRRGGFGGGDLSATVDAQGQFSIREVPAGSYQLSVRSDRRSGSLHTQTVEVVAQVVAEVAISVNTAAIEGTVTVDDGTPATELNGNVTLIAGATEEPQDLGQLRRSTGVFRARVQLGRFSFDMVPPGNYLAMLTIRGRERTNAQVFAAVGQRSSATLPAGAKSAADAAPANDGGGGNARRGGRNGAGGGGNPADPNGPAPTRRGRRGN